MAPSLNDMVPVGVPAPGDTAATVAVNVTNWPDTEGLTEEAIVVVLLAMLAVCVKLDDVLPLKLPSPL